MENRMSAADLETPRESMLVGILLTPTWIHGLATAADLLRDKYPKMPDGELLERILVAGICSVIESYTPRNQAPFGAAA